MIEPPVRRAESLNIDNTGIVTLTDCKLKSNPEIFSSYSHKAG
jgi:hypothetical protein